MSDDNSPGDGRKPYSDIGGSAAKHAQTHDVRREQLTNPTGPEPVDESFAEQIMPDSSVAGPGGHVEESVPAEADKELHTKLDMLSGEELNRLEVLAEGAALDQGAVYLDLNDLGRGPYKALGGTEVGGGDRIVAKRDMDYELWNRLVGQDENVEVERPA